MSLLTDTDDHLQTLTRHDEYYIPSGDVHFLVEHVQFRVHKYFFDRESQFFERQLSTPSKPGTPLQGSRDDNAIVLDSLAADDFAKFLWVFYNRKYSLYDSASADDWAVILSLAHRWGFPEVKNLAVRELEKKEMLDVKRIKLYHENKVDRNFLIPRYAALCERDEPLTLEEGFDLGMETTLMIARGREEARASRTATGVRSPLSPTIHGADLHAFIRDLFQISVDAEEGPYNTGALSPRKARTESTVTSTPKTPAAPRTQKETSLKPAATTKVTPTTPATTTKKAAKAQTAGQQTTKTAKVETPVQETKPAPKPLVAEKTTTTTTTTKETTNAMENHEVPSVPSTDKVAANSTTDPTSLHINTDVTLIPTPATTTTTTANGKPEGTLQPASSLFAPLEPTKLNGSASATTGLAGLDFRNVV